METQFSTTLGPRAQAESVKVLLAAEGSGGHLIPALETAQALASSNSSVMLVYSQRQHLAPLVENLMQDARAKGVQMQPIAMAPCRVPAARDIWRLWQGGAVWRVTRQQLNTFQPQVVVGFGGWISVPVVLAARQQHIPVLLHEQNVTLGRANRFLLHWADRIALSFPESLTERNRTRSLITGLPIRPLIGAIPKDKAARYFGFDPHALTVLIVGGSQGSRTVNQLVCHMLTAFSSRERATWQFIHLSGAQDVAFVQRAYEAAQVRSWTGPHLAEVAMAYALADVVVARAGASTIAELAQSGKPAILIPYPYAAGHQRANAQLVESLGAGIRLEERAATSQRLLGMLRQLLQDERLRRMMGAQMQLLARRDATQRLAHAILALVASRTPRRGPCQEPRVLAHGYWN